MPDVKSFEVFLAETAAARPEQYAEALADGARRAGVALETARAEFERMKAHVLSFYEGVRPVNSYVNASGQTIDCVPFEQQPSVRAARAAGHQITRPVSPPAPSPLEGEGHRGGTTARRPVCPEGAVPMVRLTLDQLVRCGTLDNFFRKTPPGPNKATPVK